VFLAATGQADVYIAAFDRRHFRLDSPTRLTRNDRDDVVAAWTPDNRSVLVESSRDGRQRDINKQAIDSQEPQLLAGGEDDDLGPRVTPDGQWILFTRARRSSPGWRLDTRVMRAPIDGGMAQEIFASPGWAVPQCSISGGCILYDARGDTARVSALDPLMGKADDLATVPSSEGAFISPDGAEFSYIVPQEPRNRIRTVSLRGGPHREVVVQGATSLENLDPLPDGSGWFSVNHTAEHTELLYIMRDGTSHMLWTPEQLSVDGAIPSRDLKHLAIETVTSSANAWLMTGFRRE
jgi:hypothetical protein